MCTTGKRLETPCFPFPLALFPCCQPDVCVSKCHSGGPSLMLGSCFPGLWVSVCLRVGMSVCLTVSVSS